MNRLAASIVGVTLLGLPAVASAQDRNFLMPHQHWMAPIELVFDSTDETSIGESDGIPGATERAVVMAAGQTWTDIACTEVEFVDATNYTGAGVPSVNLSNFGQDGVSAVIFEQDFGCSGGVLAYNSRWLLSASTEPLNGRTWTEIAETDTAFCQGVDFATPAEIDAPGCAGEYDMQGIALHELGHGIGYAHTCESNEVCADEELRGAVMYWAVGACDGGQRTPNAYDLETHSISYGLGSTSSFSVQNGEGGLPLDVTFTPQVIASASILSVTWDFGDGNDATTAGPVSHTYLAEGRYAVGATISANSPACGGDFTHTVRRQDVVIACNPLAPDFHYDKSGKRVKFFSDTIGAAAGCLQVLNWDFGDGSTSNVKNPIHKYATGGTYTVTLTASGPAGTSAPYTREVKVSSGGGSGLFGCSVEPGEAPGPNAAAAAGVLGVALAMSLATVRRRRLH